MSWMYEKILKHLTVHELRMHTVLHVIKLNLFPVPVRLHSGSGKLIFRRYFTIFFDIEQRCA